MRLRLHTVHYMKHEILRRCRGLASDWFKVLHENTSVSHFADPKDEFQIPGKASLLR